MSVIQCQQLTKSYRQAGNDLHVLKAINIEIQQGERLAIIGSSGAGKSTLLNLLGGLDVASTGEVFIKGQNIAELSEKQLSQLRNKEIGFVYQFHHLLMEFSAVENVAMPLLIGGENKKKAHELAAQMLEKVGMQQRLHHRPSQLSGGERQRVAIARALVNSPSCVLMDEPTGNLDEHTAEQIQALLLDLNKHLKISFIIVTHDKNIAHQQDRVLSLHEGHLQEVQLEQL